MGWNVLKACAGLIGPPKNLPVINLTQMQNSLIQILLLLMKTMME